MNKAVHFFLTNCSPFEMMALGNEEKPKPNWGNEMKTLRTILMENENKTFKILDDGFGEGELTGAELLEMIKTSWDSETSKTALNGQLYGPAVRNRMGDGGMKYVWDENGIDMFEVVS